MWPTIAVATYAALGFFLAPWLVQKNLVGSIRDGYDAELRVEKVEVNPFVLSLRLNNFELDDPDGNPVARVERIFINFQLSSLFRWAWTFDELRITAPELFVARDGSGNLNLSYLFDQTAEQPSDTAETTGEPVPSITRALVFDFAIENGAINWHDEIPVDTIDTRFGPINVEIAELNSLPNRSGQQTVLITTESTGTLSWTGSLQLNPLKSVAHASIKGSHFPLASAYFNHQTGFDIVEGNADVELDYIVDTLADGTISAAVENFNLTFNDVVVYTFSGALGVDATSEDREVLTLPEVRLTGGELYWPEKTLAIEALAINNPLVKIYRDEAGVLNIEPPVPDPGAVDDKSGNEAGSDGDWQVSLQSLAINHLVLDLEDHSVRPFADVGIRDFALSISDISNTAGTRFPTSLDMQVRTGGTLKMNGSVAVLPEVEFNFDVAIDNIALAGAHPYIKPLADVNMESGALNLMGKIDGTGEELFAFDGDLEIVDFEITETDEGSRLGSWRRMAARNVEFSAGKQRLDISEVLLDHPFGDIVIAADGSLNLGRIEKGSDTESDKSEMVLEKESTEPLLAVTVGRVAVKNAAADFADLSLPLPFSVRIEDLNGDMTTITTESSEPSTVSFEGKVDEHGFVRVTGSITPLDPSANTDVTVTFQNVPMPKFTAYTVPFAGREIASGSLDLSLGYQVTDSQLVGENSIILRDFELGEKVPHPDAMSLPLGLAVALLKDAEGKINIDLPVRGDLEDPEFSYGGVVWSALGNLIVKIVASPFALLGKLIGVEASELEYIEFIDGRSDLTPPELQKAAKLAEALALRPELVLEISGVMDKEADGLALRTAQLEGLVEERIAASESSGDNENMYAKKRALILESLYREKRTTQDAEFDAQGLRAAFTTQSVGEDGDATEAFDELAYAKELQIRLTDLQILPDTALANLARSRAENARSAILAIDESLQERIVIPVSKSVEKESDEMIRMKVALVTAN